MLKKLKLNITCDEATTICDKSQYGEATFMEKLKLQLHILHCKICSRYSKQNSLLTKAYNSKAKEEKKATLCMSDEEKEMMRKELEKLHS